MYPILFEIGNLKIYTYGIMVALGFLIAVYLASREAKRAGIVPERIFDIGLQSMLFGIISARALHVFVNLSYYIKSPIDIVMINRGGLAFQGGLLGGVIAAWLYVKRNRMDLWKTADVMIPYVALAQSVGRVGCFLNGCCYGTPTLLPIGIYLPGHLLHLHPTQVYSSVFLLFTFVILKKIYRKKRFDGAVFFSYLTIYSFGRFFIDFLRGDLYAVYFGLKVSQIIAAVIFFPSLFILILKWKNIRSR